ncbi:lycopene cyclase domain-containing protein [Cryobacterium flavum]|uniref:Lycopene cyclase domain-containing protein n=1 Tax=Cryobacterium flavum TaxID=1424659 RepID=A0A4R8UWP1_9MICO|nr:MULTISPECIES: lycopene cyclase domain-containing protein [Cryobacterium]TFB73012.1 lycopene cyclase domain-containing protein [Cryobacterium flavum]TFD03535.1 lycopene cyclase domain-containing protein [Cryobacterium sp. TMT1-66-1]TFD12798.1 lycopene cyclase domain-containing protein [Cryobacterium sp. TMT1-2-2]SDN03760.1 lycopene cyclase domain-containing protein [Cryobacterium flavum]
MSVLYLLTLLVSLGGMVVLDWRFRLFFWRSPGRAALVLGIGVLFFLGWDLAGIGLGIFYRGETSLMTGVQLAPELPLEEFFFLTFLCYLTMNLVQGARLVQGRRATK